MRFNDNIGMASITFEPDMDFKIMDKIVYAEDGSVLYTVKGDVAQMSVNFNDKQVPVR